MITEDNYDVTSELARQTSANEGWQLVQDASWENYEKIPAMIMAGYLTMFKELEDSLHDSRAPKIDLVFLQAGVGSWAATAIWYYLKSYGSFAPRMIIVEPLEAAGILASFNADKRVTPNGSYDTIMAGLNCGIPSLNAWEIISKGANASMRIIDEYCKRAMRELYFPESNDFKITAGESGAAGLAGFIALMTMESMQELKKEMEITENTNILFFNTEGATDPVSFNSIIDNELQH